MARCTWIPALFSSVSPLLIGCGNATIGVDVDVDGFIDPETYELASYDGLNAPDLRVSTGGR